MFTTHRNPLIIFPHCIALKDLLERGTVEELPLKAATISELKSLCLALLDNVNDKSLALSHQKKTNKLLAAKIAELEQRILALTGTNEIASISSLSPSQILLNGYTSATVDLDLSEETKQLKIANQSEHSSDNSADGAGLNGCTEGTSSNTSQGLPTELLSSESNKSLPSCSGISEPDYVGESSSDMTSNAGGSTGILLDPYSRANHSGSTDSKLPELPPEIAELVRQFTASMLESDN